MEVIKVHVVEFSDRKFYMMQYRDPLTGRKKTRSTKVERTGRKRERTEAERVAAKWEAELRAGRYREPSKVTWQEFRERYESEVLPGLADNTDEKVQGVFNHVEKILNPSLLRDIDEGQISMYQAELRRRGRSEDTIRGHLAHLASSLRWGQRIGLLVKMPSVVLPKRCRGAKSMKGRPITAEEFERMLYKTPAIVGDTAAASWQRYMTGLWLSGLRLKESLHLFWDRHDRLSVDLDGRRPMLRIRAELEKGHQDRLLPMAPEFAEFLMRTPEVDRTGLVFPLVRRCPGRIGQITHRHVSKVICQIGKKAGVKVDTDPTTGKVKYASAHDLRRSFGERWASRIMPNVLMELMRHEDISTTMKYYVGRNAERTADVLWEAWSNTSGNSGPKPGSGQWMGDVPSVDTD